MIAEVPLVAVADVDRSFTKFNAYALENFPNSPWFTVGIVAGAVLSALYIALCIYASYRAKKMSHRKTRSIWCLTQRNFMTVRSGTGNALTQYSTMVRSPERNTIRMHRKMQKKRKKSLTGANRR